MEVRRYVFKREELMKGGESKMEEKIKNFVKDTGLQGEEANTMVTFAVEEENKRSERQQQESESKKANLNASLQLKISELKRMLPDEQAFLLDEIVNMLITKEQ